MHELRELNLQGIMSYIFLVYIYVHSIFFYQYRQHIMKTGMNIWFNELLGIMLLTNIIQDL